MSETDIEKVRRLNRERQRRFYQAHKKEITEKKANERNLFKEWKQNRDQPETPEPAPDPTPENPEPQPKYQRNKRPIIDYEYTRAYLKWKVGNEKTQKKYLGDLRTVHKITQFSNLNRDLLHPVAFWQKIETSRQTKDPTKGYSTNSLKGYIQTICYVFDNVKYCDIPNDIKAKYRAVFDRFKTSSKKQTKERQQDMNHAVMDADTYLELVEAHYGTDSKEFLIVSLYSEVTARDNFGRINIIKTAKEADKKKNFIVVPSTRTGRCVVILNDYKTKGKYKQYEGQLSSNLTKLVKNYTTNNDLTYGDFLFNEKQLSPVVTKINKDMGIYDDTTGSINQLRHMVISSHLAKHKEMTDAERNEFARQCMHSPISNLDHIRQIL